MRNCFHSVFSNFCPFFYHRFQVGHRIIILLFTGYILTNKKRVWSFDRKYNILSCYAV